jgi:hypothetical protein
MPRWISVLYLQYGTRSTLHTAAVPLPKPTVPATSPKQPGRKRPGALQDQSFAFLTDVFRVVRGNVKGAALIVNVAVELNRVSPEAR